MSKDVYDPLEEAPQWYYRGVHGKHPSLTSAKEGVVVPGDRHGIVTQAQHNEGAQIILANSQYTSWTAMRSIAQAHARKNPFGVVLRLPAKPRQGDTWYWEWSPDKHYEAEILLYGVRMDAEVLD